MSGFQSVAHLMATIASESANVSKHKTARALRYLYRHPTTRRHRRIIAALQAAHRRQLTHRIAERHARRLEWSRAPFDKHFERGAVARNRTA